MLDKLRAMCNLVENAPKGVQYKSSEIIDDGKSGELPTIYLESGIEEFREPIGLLFGTEAYNWFGFMSEGVLVCQPFPRDGSGSKGGTKI